MRFFHFSLAFLFAALSSMSCLAVYDLASGDPESDPNYGLLALLGFRLPPSTVNVSEAPIATLPGGISADQVTVTRNERLAAPAFVNGAHAPIGHVYDVKMVAMENAGFAGAAHVYFGGEKATLTYSYDAAGLRAANLAEEFSVYYYDYDEEAWFPLDDISVDTDAATVTVRTSHLTPFVLTAAPIVTGNLLNAPACVSADFPGGIGGSASATFAIVDENFKYYQDRNYLLESAGAFHDLGFAGSLGIATCNGGGACGPTGAHKQYTGANYINFTAHIDLDLYIMYDSRGGSDINDDSNDAAWLAADGFVNTGKFIHTTDAVGQYRVYMKSYSAGDPVALHGNRHNHGSNNINTNYWAVIKPAGSNMPGDAGLSCTIPELGGPGLVSDLKLVPGANGMLISWNNPGNASFAGVVIRRSTMVAPGALGDGVAPTGSVIHSEMYQDAGLAPNTTYYYSVFAVDNNGNHLGVVALRSRTGTDSDGDGIADYYENSFIYPFNNRTDKDNSDTDGDGISDLDELIAGTDPTGGDTIAPVVTAFTTPLSSPTTNNEFTYTISATDNAGVVAYFIKHDDATRPTSSSPGWQASSSGSITLSYSGTHSFYAWAIDAAGNISADVAPIVLDLESLVTADFVFGTSGNNILSFKIDQDTGRHRLSWVNNLSYDPTFQHGYSVNSILANPTGRYLFSYDSSATKIRVYEIDPITGELTQKSETSVRGALTDHAFTPNGRFYYASFGHNGGLSAYSFDQTSGALTEIQHLTSHGFEFMDIDVNSAGTNLVAAGVGVSMHTIDQATGRLSYVRWHTLEPFDMRHISVAFHASQNIFYASQEPLHITSAHFHPGTERMGAFSYDPGSGYMHRLQSEIPFDWRGKYSLTFDPRHNWVYLSDWVQPFGAPAPHHRTWRATTNGTSPAHSISTFGFGVEFDGQNVENLQFFTPRGWAYGNNSAGAGGPLVFYRSTGGAFLNTAMHSEGVNIKRIALSQSKSVNDPPVINILPYGSHYNSRAKNFWMPKRFPEFANPQMASGRAFVNFRITDPDMARCGINVLADHLQASVLSKPAAYAHPAGAISVMKNQAAMPVPHPVMYIRVRKTADGAKGYMIANHLVPGNYEISLSTRDDGTDCGSSRGTTKTFSFEVIPGAGWDGLRYYKTGTTPPTEPEFLTPAYAASFAVARGNGHMSVQNLEACGTHGCQALRFDVVKEVKTFLRSCHTPGGLFTFTICIPEVVEYVCTPPNDLGGYNHGTPYYLRPYNVRADRSYRDRKVLDWCIANKQAAPNTIELFQQDSRRHEFVYEDYYFRHFYWIAP
ncbi:MAG: hypothetical protein NXI24_05280 [bacterium]|nr:hypothetical protein [bacterium]